MRQLTALLSLMALSACSGGEVSNTLHADATKQSIHAETAKYFATSTRNVAVGYLKPGILGTSYKAKVAGKVYDCHYVKRAVSCSRA